MCGGATCRLDHHEVLRAFPVQAVGRIGKDIWHAVVKGDLFGFRHGVILCGVPPSSTVRAGGPSTPPLLLTIRAYRVRQTYPRHKQTHQGQSATYELSSFHALTKCQTEADGCLHLLFSPQAERAG